MRDSRCVFACAVIARGRMAGSVSMLSLLWFACARTGRLALALLCPLSRDYKECTTSMEM